jgi:NADPH:quinone reductase-like Zn-dependent oxidoreductase
MYSKSGLGALPATMHAVRLHSDQGIEGLQYEHVETPRPGPGEALVRVHAAAITRDELYWPVDRLPATPSYEFSGVIAALGPGVVEAAIGDEVYALSGFDRDGAAADFVSVPANVLAPKPTSLDHFQSAALPLAALTAWQALFDRGRLEEGQRVLISGAAGGVGHLAIQLARGRGAYVIGAASAAKLPSVESFGAHEVLDPTGTPLEDVGEPMDLVFDTVGGDLLTRAPAILRPGGMLVSIAEEPPETSLGARIDAEYFVVEPNRDQLIQIAHLADRGELKPAIDSVFPLVEAHAAFSRSVERVTSGKVILKVSDD